MVTWLEIINIKGVSMERPKRGQGKGSPVEDYLVSMNKIASEVASSESEFDSVELCAQMENVLLLIRKAMKQENFSEIDLLAREIVEKGLKVGATEILNYSLDLQSLARRSDLDGIDPLVRLLETELSRVQSYLSKTG